MSDREIINSKQGIPMWWKPGIAFLKEEWKSMDELKDRIDTEVCVSCNEINSFSIVR